MIDELLTASQKVHLRRFAASSVIAAYRQSTPHFFGFARLASGAFYCAV